MDGVGATKNSAPIIDAKHEDLFWEKGLLGSSSPKILQLTVFYYVGTNFVLQGVQEKHDLTLSQLGGGGAQAPIRTYEYCSFIEVVVGLLART